MPDGEAPPEGWPTVIFLHTYGKAAAISPEERLLFGEMGVAYIEINGTQMLSENSFRWSNYSDESTHTAIQRTLQQLAPQLKLNTQRIYLSARGRGALHAANLIAKYPQFYAGALLIAPNGEIKPAQQSLAAQKKIVMAYYDRQNFSEQALALHFANLFGEDNQVQTLHFARGRGCRRQLAGTLQAAIAVGVGSGAGCDAGCLGFRAGRRRPFGSQWPSTKTIFSTNSSATTTTHGLISRQRPVPSFITQ